MIKCQSIKNIFCIWKREFTIKAVIYDSNLFTNRTLQQKLSSPELINSCNLGTSSGHDICEIEGVTDITAKYRSKLRQKNIFRSSLVKTQHSTGDATLLRTVKEALETYSDRKGDDVPQCEEMKEIINYSDRRGLVQFVAFFKGSSYLGAIDWVKGVTNKPLLCDVTVLEAVGNVQSSTKVSLKHLLILSAEPDVLSQSTKAHVITCYCGYVVTTFSIMCIY